LRGLFSPFFVLIVQKIKYLEGLRGFAAFVVFLHHIKYLFYLNTEKTINQKIFSLDFLPSFIKTFLTDFLYFFTDGHLFVWVFWYLSAYALSINLFKNVDDQNLVYKSALKRFPRLFIPISASVLIALFLFTSNLFYNQQAGQVLQSIAYDSSWLRQFYNFQFDLARFFQFFFLDIYLHYDFSFTYNSVLWSIQSEFLGSMLVFAIFGIVRKNKNRFFVYILVISVLIHFGLYTYIPFVIGYLFTDFDYETIHPLIQKIKRIESNFFHFAGLNFLLFVIIVIGIKQILNFYECEQATISLVQAGIILLFVRKNPWLNKFFEWKWIYLFGKVSFSFYLIHFLVICSLSSYMITISLSFPFKIIIVLSTFALSLLISIFFYKFIDKFAVRISNQFANYLTKNNSL
jgi:peptidoglycan/LPS O-acetylase OafA/YrhL